MPKLEQKRAKNMETYCTVRSLAIILGISERRIQQLTKINVLKKAAHGKYDLFASLRGYVRYLKRLSRRYMTLYRYCVEANRGKTNFRNLPFYEDLQPFREEEFMRMFEKKALHFQEGRGEMECEELGACTPIKTYQNCLKTDDSGKT